MLKMIVAALAGLVAACLVAEIVRLLAGSDTPTLVVLLQRLVVTVNIVYLNLLAAVTVVLSSITVARVVVFLIACVVSSAWTAYHPQILAYVDAIYTALWPYTLHPLLQLLPVLQSAAAVVIGFWNYAIDTSKTTTRVLFDVFVQCAGSAEDNGRFIKTIVDALVDGLSAVVDFCSTVWTSPVPIPLRVDGAIGVIAKDASLLVNKTICACKRADVIADRVLFPIRRHDLLAPLLASAFNCPFTLLQIPYAWIVSAKAKPPVTTPSAQCKSLANAFGSLLDGWFDRVFGVQNLRFGSILSSAARMGIAYVNKLIELVFDARQKPLDTLVREHESFGDAVRTVSGTNTWAFVRVVGDAYHAVSYSVFFLFEFVQCLTFSTSTSCLDQSLRRYPKKKLLETWDRVQIDVSDVAFGLIVFGDLFSAVPRAGHLLIDTRLRAIALRSTSSGDELADILKEGDLAVDKAVAVVAMSVRSLIRFEEFGMTPTTAFACEKDATLNLFYQDMKARQRFNTPALVAQSNDFSCSWSLWALNNVQALLAPIRVFERAFYANDLKFSFSQLTPIIVELIDRVVLTSSDLVGNLLAFPFPEKLAVQALYGSSNISAARLKELFEHARNTTSGTACPLACASPCLVDVNGLCKRVDQIDPVYLQQRPIAASMRVLVQSIVQPIFLVPLQTVASCVSFFDSIVSKESAESIVLVLKDAVLDLALLIVDCVSDGAYSVMHVSRAVLKDDRIQKKFLPFLAKVRAIAQEFTNAVVDLAFQVVEVVARLLLFFSTGRSSQLDEVLRIVFEDMGATGAQVADVAERAFRYMLDSVPILEAITETVCDTFHILNDVVNALTRVVCAPLKPLEDLPGSRLWGVKNILSALTHIPDKCEQNVRQVLPGVTVADSLLAVCRPDLHGSFGQVAAAQYAAPCSTSTDCTSNVTCAPDIESCGQDSVYCDPVLGVCTHVVSPDSKLIPTTCEAVQYESPPPGPPAPDRPPPSPPGPPGPPPPPNPPFLSSNPPYPPDVPFLPPFSPFPPLPPPPYAPPSRRLLWNYAQKKRLCYVNPVYNCRSREKSQSFDECRVRSSMEDLQGPYICDIVCGPDNDDNKLTFYDQTMLTGASCVCDAGIYVGSNGKVTAENATAQFNTRTRRSLMNAKLDVFDPLKEILKPGTCIGTDFLPVACVYCQNGHLAGRCLPSQAVFDVPVSSGLWTGSTWCDVIVRDTVHPRPIEKIAIRLCSKLQLMGMALKAQYPAVSSDVFYNPRSFWVMLKSVNLPHVGRQVSRRSLLQIRGGLSVLGTFVTRPFASQPSSLVVPISSLFLSRNQSQHVVGDCAIVSTYLDENYRSLTLLLDTLKMGKLARKIRVPASANATTFRTFRLARTAWESYVVGWIPLPNIPPLDDVITDFGRRCPSEALLCKRRSRVSFGAGLGVALLCSVIAIYALGPLSALLAGFAFFPLYFMLFQSIVYDVPFSSRCLGYVATCLFDDLSNTVVRPFATFPIAWHRTLLPDDARDGSGFLTKPFFDCRSVHMATSYQVISYASRRFFGVKLPLQEADVATNEHAVCFWLMLPTVIPTLLAVMAGSAMVVSATQIVVTVANFCFEALAATQQRAELSPYTYSSPSEGPKK